MKIMSSPHHHPAALLGLCLGLFSQSLSAAPPDTWPQPLQLRSAAERAQAPVVLAVVEKSALNDPAALGGQHPSGEAPIYRVQLSVTEVLRGPQDLVGQKVFTFSSSAPPFSDRLQFVRQSLIPGTTCKLVLFKERDGQWYDMGLVAAHENSDVLDFWVHPARLFQGIGGYAHIVEELRKRRDHPEYKVPDAEALPQPQPPSPADFLPPSVTSNTPVVLAVVEKLSLNDEQQMLGRIYGERHPGQAPVYRAEFRITEVLHGPPILLGQKFYSATSAERYEDDTNNFIVPGLKLQDEGLFAITPHLASDDLWYDTALNFPPDIDESRPVSTRMLKNRDPRYDGIVSGLRDHRDHPEKYPAPAKPASPQPRQPLAPVVIGVVSKKTLNQKEQMGGQRPSGSAPIHRLQFRITEVLRGPQELLGKTFDPLSTASLEGAAPFNFILPDPSLKDEGVFALYQERDGSWYDIGIGGPFDAHDPWLRLPRILKNGGLGFDYDNIIGEFRRRRDHPERSQNLTRPLPNGDSKWKSQFHLVIGETQSVQPFKRSGTTQPLGMVATLKITEVLRGPQDLLGQTFQAFTSEKFMDGNTCYITPVLKPGELCISAVARNGDEKKELWMSSWGGVLVGEDMLPCIQGRKVNPFYGDLQDYDLVLARLRHRREHPEAYAKVDFNVPPAPPKSTGEKGQVPSSSKP